MEFSFAATYADGAVPVSVVELFDTMPRSAVKSESPRPAIPERYSDPLKSLSILSLSTEFPNPVEPAKGLFVRSRLQAIAAKAHLMVIAPVALFDYANPHNKFLASFD